MNTEVALAVLRCVTGLSVVAHGYSKIFMGGKLSGTAGWFESIGMKPGWMHARVAAFTEVGAGLLFAIGLLTPLAGAAIVALMIVAAWTVHRHSGFFIVSSGWEYNFILGAIAVCLSGGHPPSVDALLGISETLGGWWGVGGSALAGTAAAVIFLAAFYRPPVAVRPDADATTDR